MTGAAYLARSQPMPITTRDGGEIVDGGSAALVVRGEPGVGKTILLNALVNLSATSSLSEPRVSNQSCGWAMRGCTASSSLS